MNELDKKIIRNFSGVVCRKDLVKNIKNNAIVPNYVLEYLLGQHCATSDEAAIQSGINTVKNTLLKNYVNRKDANLMRSTIREKGCYEVIDKISVFLNDKDDRYEAIFSNLGIPNARVASRIAREHPCLLGNATWCIASIEYRFNENKKISPWILSSLQQIQSPDFDIENFIKARKKFTTAEWINLLIQSIGFKPAMLDMRRKLLHLIRLIPYCEQNYNLIELGPKSTGKSHIYSELSPYGILISGGEVSVAKLFVNNVNNKLGLVGYRDVVAFDEFAGNGKKVDKLLVDMMKNFMANKSFSRGIEPVEAEASMVFIGNTQERVSFMLQHSNLFEALPAKFRDSAFLDRLHFYLPGWEVNIIREEMFSDGYGFVVDYLAEFLHSMRKYDYSDRYKLHFTLSANVPKRDQDGINKTFSGLMKIIHPDDDATKEEIEEILNFAIEGRKRVKDHLMRIDATFPKVTFSYQDITSEKVKYVSTLEGQSFQDYLQKIANNTGSPKNPSSATSKRPLEERSVIIFYNERGVTFDDMFGKYLHGASKITITDALIHSLHQIQNFIEFLGTVVKHKDRGADVTVHLMTTEDFRVRLQQNYFEEIKDCFEKIGVLFTWEFDNASNTRTSEIITDHGWRIILGRGLDIFREYEKKDTSLSRNVLQRKRYCEEFEVVFLKDDNSSRLSNNISNNHF